MNSYACTHYVCLSAHKELAFATHKMSTKIEQYNKLTKKATGASCTLLTLGCAVLNTTL